jgi:hypothetical protein
MMPVSRALHAAKSDTRVLPYTFRACVRIM